MTLRGLFLVAIALTLAESASAGRARTTRTARHGGFLLFVPVVKTSIFRASVSVPDRDVTTTVCPPCVSASAAVSRPRADPSG
jgi:hypothetical protein